MKKNIMLYLLMALVCFGLQSCLFQEEDYFDDSSANRATEEGKQQSELLESASNGWRMEYYIGPVSYTHLMLLLACLLASIGLVIAQTPKKVTGVVISEEDDYFDDSSANRATEEVKQYSEPVSYTHLSPEDS